MDLKFVDFCIKYYDGKLDQDDAARLSFFRELWQVRDDAYDAAMKEHELEEVTVPSEEVLAHSCDKGLKFFKLMPPSVPLKAFAQVASAVAEYLVDKGSLDEATSDALRDFKWEEALKVEPPKCAASDPEGWLDRFAEGLYAGEYTEAQAHMLALVASMALRAFYEEPAAKCMEVIADNRKAIGAHPLKCPVCGSSPSVGSVGGKTSSDGRGKRLFCQQCGTAWEFDRVRCGRCGTHDQTKLHFFNIEGDEDHRIATCDECGNYMRVTYIENNLIPLSFDVEDVVMARLDALAQDPRFMKDAE